jgi:hypothetical protein
MIKIYTNITSPVVLCGCEILCITLKEKCGLKVFENRVLRRMFGPKRDEVTSWRKMHNEGLNNSLSSSDIMITKSK